MMYHFMFGLRGGSLVAVTDSEPADCSPPAATSFFSSSCMIKFKLRFARRSGLVTEIAVQECDALLNEVIDHKKVNAKNEYRDYHHRRRSLYFFPGRRGDLAHFSANVVIKRL